MKKSIALIIAVIYLASIIIIGFFGRSISVYEEQIYPTEIEIMNDDVKTSPDPSIGKYISLRYDPDGNENENVYFLQWRVLPEDCTNKKVIFQYNDPNDIIDIVETTGLIRIKGIGEITLQIFCETTPSVKAILSISIRRK